MKISRFRKGCYILTLHGHSFTLEKLSDDRYWTLYNARDTEISRVETKGGMIELMQSWSPEYTATKAAIDFCIYA